MAGYNTPRIAEVVATLLVDDPICTVLVVEDESFVSMVVVEELESEGCHVIEASSGEVALTHLNNGHAVDVVFTDIRLGGDVDGWDVAEAFRKEDPTTGVIYTSGRGVEQQREVPGSLFYGKPYKPAEIVGACLQLAKDRALH